MLSLACGEVVTGIPCRPFTGGDHAFLIRTNLAAAAAHVAFRRLNFFGLALTVARRRKAGIDLAELVIGAVRVVFAPGLFQGVQTVEIGVCLVPRAVAVGPVCSALGEGETRIFREPQANAVLLKKRSALCWMVYAARKASQNCVAGKALSRAFITAGRRSS